MLHAHGEEGGGWHLHRAEELLVVESEGQVRGRGLTHQRGHLEQEERDLSTQHVKMHFAELIIPHRSMRCCVPAVGTPGPLDRVTHDYPPRDDPQDFPDDTSQWVMHGQRKKQPLHGAVTLKSSGSET